MFLPYIKDTLFGGTGSFNDLGFAVADINERLGKQREASYAAYCYSNGVTPNPLLPPVAMIPPHSLQKAYRRGAVAGIALGLLAVLITLLIKYWL